MTYFVVFFEITAQSRYEVSQIGIGMLGTVFSFIPRKSFVQLVLTSFPALLDKALSWFQFGGSFRLLGNLHIFDQLFDLQCM